MRNHQFTELIIKDVNYSSEQQARQLVLEGLKEHFGYLDPTRNPDLDHIVDHYLSKGVVFLTGFVGDELVCTGALVSVDASTGRIVRISVKKEHRRKGYALLVMEKLEKRARQKGHTRLFLKTIQSWSDAVGFYLSRGYTVTAWEGEKITMSKNL